MRQFENVSQRAALYIRMSTEHQNYSIVNQTATLERYAKENNMAIVKRFVDPGRSGLTISRRRGLKALLVDVLSNQADFQHVLVFDVSRWSRSLDPDEAAYCEYSCKKEHIQVHYCVEPFTNDGSVYASLIKHLKRIMAGEYSRELSAKVSAAHMRLARLGFRQGGAAGYGIRRQLVDRDGKAKGWLKPGERKAFQSDRVMLKAGPKSETDVVRQIFEWFVADGMYETQIARLLNQRDINPEYFKKWVTCQGWTNSRVHQVLTNPKYIGAIVYNKTSGKLSTKRVQNAAEQWARRDQAFEAIVDPKVYAKAQEIIKGRFRRLDDSQILDRLTALLKKEGRLSTEIIDNDPNILGVKAIAARFQSLSRAYELIGYKRKRDTASIVTKQRHRRFNCLGEAILAAAASGKLKKTFTIDELRAACPGWSRLTYSSTCAIYVNQSEPRPVKLKRIGRGEFRIVASRSGIRFRMVNLDDKQVLKRLAALLKRKGRLSAAIIDKDRDTPSMTAIKHRFGKLRTVYALLGYTRKIEQVGIRQKFRDRKTLRGPESMAQAISEAVKSGRLPATFTIAELKVACPGWAYDSYYTMPAYYSRDAATDTSIRLSKLSRGKYQLLKA